MLKGDIRVTTDTGKLQLGASQDLQIFHDGNNSVISDSGTGELQFKEEVTQFLLYLSMELKLQIQMDSQQLLLKPLKILVLD